MEDGEVAGGSAHPATAAAPRRFRGRLWACFRLRRQTGNRSIAKSRTDFVVFLLFMQGTWKVCVRIWF